jgi:hypothetical protein
MYDTLLLLFRGVRLIGITYPMKSEFANRKMAMPDPRNL